MTSHIVWSISKTKLSCHDRLYWVRFVMKSKKDNDVTDLIGLVYAKIKIELSRPI